ncbi:hypothetical protein EXIGLDRAFT_719110 [Exidia glandulosa HHB12029]|uniref:Uncharacterized protein n=1 Tax=Exidia glandulosa HHB12029 TaxID=1314781 RepID=A0A166AGR6_EXIGL|nr:hypothetical protein EXIGLDRAFT_719110 [Exidia glandulosa HHB12029]
MGIIIFLLAVALTALWCHRRRKRQNRSRPRAGQRSDIESNMAVKSLPTHSPTLAGRTPPLRVVTAFEEPRMFFRPPDAESRGPSSPGLPVDERLPGEANSRAATTQLLSLPPQATSAISPTLTFRIHNPDTATSVSGSSHASKQNSRTMSGS